MEINLATTILKNPNSLEAETGEDLTMMDIENGVYYTLNKVGREIWKKIEQPTTIQSICDQLSDQYNIDNEKCSKDIILFAKKMLENNLITIKN